MAPWSKWVDTEEFVPELQWPNSIKVYEQMRSDSQLSALYTATLLGCMKFKWSINPNECEEEMVQKFSTDYNLPVLGEPFVQLRQKRRFAFQNHMRKAYKAGIYGSYFFEQIGEIADDGLWHLRKLAERPPSTIDDFRIAEDGGLISIIQNLPTNRGALGLGFLPEIPIDRLVGYVWDQEGANWAGRSWMRDCYKNWIIKDRLLRVDAINHERAGGVPYVEAQPGATMAEVKELNDMAMRFRIGDTSGGAVPSGAKVVIAKGTNSSVIDSIRYHDEAMARRWMLMVMQLGQTQTGSRALGTTFVDFWGQGLTAMADWFRDTFNEHVIEDDVDWNWGEDVDQVPLLHYEYDPELVVDDLTKAITSGAIVVDDDLEFYVRKEMGLPDKGEPRLTPQQEMEQQKIDQAGELGQAALEQKADQTQAQQTANSQAATTRAGAGQGAPSDSRSLGSRVLAKIKGGMNLGGEALPQDEADTVEE